MIGTFEVERPVRTEKGERGAGRLVDAATIVLARDGFSGASLARITEEAGVPKRMVAYYFGSREALLAQVVVGIGEGFAARLEAGIAPLLAADIDGETAVARAIDQLWEATISQPEAVRAYFTLVSGQWSGEAQAALIQLKDDYRELALRLLAVKRRSGTPLRSGDADVVVRLGLALLRGIALEWIEDAESPALPGMLDAAKRLLAEELR